jgi:murein DD-endopeptidase MepM/ murein hydrolase activator NlpD
LTPSGTCTKLFRIMMRSLRHLLRAVAAMELRWRVAGVFLAVSALAMGLTLVTVGRQRGRYIFYPSDCAGHWRLGSMPPVADNEAESGGTPAMGGEAAAVLPLDVKDYIVKEGDTLSAVAERFDLDLDTIASLNRQWGSGVHLVRVGEKIRIPNQDGIFIALDRPLEKLCADKGVPVEAVLQANNLGRGEARQGLQLFFPGVQHKGIERSVVIGTAFLRPVAGWTSSAYGYRQDPFTESMEFHRGVDIAAAPGTPVRSALDGKVTVVGLSPVLGLYIVIRHQIGYSTVYGHLLEAFVQPGQTVARGQRIGRVGSSGKSTGPHLHFEVRRNGRPVNTTGLLSSKR